MSLQEVRGNHPFFEGIPDTEITESQKLDPTAITEVAQKVKSREWDSVMDLCSKDTHGYRLLLGAHLKDEITDLDTATGLIFLNLFLSSDRTVKVSESSVFANGKTYTFFQMPVPESLRKEGVRTPAFCEFEPLMDLWSDSLKTRVIGGLSTRMGMIQRLQNLECDIGILLPHQRVNIHGYETEAAGSAQHDFEHIAVRRRVIEALGAERFKLAMDHAEILEKCLATLPEYTKPTTTDTREPLLQKDSNFKDAVRYLIDITAGRIVDGNFSPRPLTQLDQSSMRQMLEETAEMVSHSSEFKPLNRDLVPKKGVLSGAFLTKGVIDAAMAAIESQGFLQNDTQPEAASTSKRIKMSQAE